MNTAYAGMITSMDDGIGQIMTKLKELGISQNTLVMFTSDNGLEISWDFFDSFKDFRGGKRSITDGGIRMPTVVHWPGVIKPGTEIDIRGEYKSVLSFIDTKSMKVIKTYEISGIADEVR